MSGFSLLFVCLRLAFVFCCLFLLIVVHGFDVCWLFTADVCVLPVDCWLFGVLVLVVRLCVVG